MGKKGTCSNFYLTILKMLRKYLLHILVRNVRICSYCRYYCINLISKQTKMLSSIATNSLLQNFNTNFSRKMFIDLYGRNLQPYILHPTRNEKLLFLIFDFTHNLKNIFNNFLSKKRMHIATSGLETVLGSLCLGLFSHIKQLYALEEHKI